MRGALFLVCGLALLDLYAGPARGRADDDEVGVGTLLVADRDLKDPNFAQTVILIAKYDDEGTLGIIVNRRTDVPVSRVLEKWKEAKRHSEPVFLGGPMEKSAALALVRSKSAIEGALKLGRGIQFVAEPAQLQKALSLGPPDETRIYFGYVGWAADQLENEIEEGAWHVFPFDAGIAFDADPDAVWPRLIKKTETQIAALPRSTRVY